MNDDGDQQQYEEDDDDDDDDDDEDDAEDKPDLPAQGTGVDYCVFCYHGTGILRPDNTALLSRFVSERGAILPKRFTKCCPKHQRALATVLKRARTLYLIPIHAKLHPQARFSSFSPPRPAGKAPASAVNPAHGPTKGFSEVLLAELAKP
jgi:small subunit ribosomal protein S18